MSNHEKILYSRSSFSFFLDYSPKDLDTYVKYEFPYPNVSHMHTHKFTLDFVS